MVINILSQILREEVWTEVLKYLTEMEPPRDKFNLGDLSVRVRNGCSAEDFQTHLLASFGSAGLKSLQLETRLLVPFRAHFLINPVLQCGRPYRKPPPLWKTPSLWSLSFPSLLYATQALGVIC